jgi:predicted transcriptional regulator
MYERSRSRMTRRMQLLLDPATEAELTRLAQELRVSRAAVVRLAVHELARRRERAGRQERERRREEHR